MAHGVKFQRNLQESGHFGEESVTTMTGWMCGEQCCAVEEGDHTLGQVLAQ